MKGSLLLVLGLALILSGCTHALEVKNRKDYLVTAPSDTDRSLVVGVATENHLGNGGRLVEATVESLRNRLDKVIYPYANSSNASLLINMAVTTDFKGDSLNFWINWPGFLVWAPAWHGYIYKPSYSVQIEIRNLASGNVVDNFSVPINLDVRHADLNRTWTEVSWFEVSLIALVGGISFTSYDNTVTPLVEQDMKQELGFYLADKILQHIARLKPPTTGP